jgi:hypothetical protein
MQGEAELVTAEVLDRGRAARMRDPQTGRDRFGHASDLAVWHAEDDEIGLADVHLPGRRARGQALAEPGGEGRPDASCADDAC